MLSAGSGCESLSLAPLSRLKSTAFRNYLERLHERTQMSKSVAGDILLLASQEKLQMMSENDV